jgi:hypothetical protein
MLEVGVRALGWNLTPVVNEFVELFGDDGVFVNQGLN